MRDYNNIKRVIIKIGSSSLMDGNKTINKQMITNLCNTIIKLINNGIEVLLVTSGAIAVGYNKMGLRSKPKEVPLKQACAAVGQVALMQSYEEIFEESGIFCAQILVSHDDFESRKRMVNLSNTLETLLEKKIVPIINENDVLAVEEIKLGDNDTLAAMLLPMIDADLLVLLSDIDGLYDKNPKEFDDAKLISEVTEITNDIEKMAGKSTTNVGTGGMMTKIQAARMVMDYGANMVILNSNNLTSIEQLLQGENVGTWFSGNKNEKLSSRMHWLLYKSYAKGNVIVDSGASNAILSSRVSLLPKGVKGVEGHFLSGSAVFIVDENNEVIAKGIANYSSDEIKLIMGKPSKEIAKVLGYKDKDEIIHANDMIIIKGENYGNIK